MRSSQPIAKFGHAFNSEKMNEESRKMYEDLKEAYERIEQMEADHEKVREGYASELSQMDAYIKGLDRHVNMLEALVASNGQMIRRGILYAPDMQTTYPDKGQDASETDARGVVYAEEFAAGVKPIRKSSKLTMRSQDGRDVAPEAVGVRIARTNNGGEVRDEGTREVLDGTGIWKRIVSYDSSVSPLEEDAIYEVDIPMLTSGNRDINEIIVEGHPFRGVTIESVQVEVYEKWEEIAIKKREYESDRAMGAVRLRFPDVPASRVRIHLRQSQAKRRGTKTLFEIGLKRIEVNRNSYDEEPQVLLGRLVIPGAKGVQSIEVRFENEVARHQYRTELCRKVSGILIPIDASRWQSLTDQELWVRTELQYDANRRVAPMIQQIEVLLARQT